MASALTQTVSVTNGLLATAHDFGTGAFAVEGCQLDLRVRYPAGPGAFTRFCSRHKPWGRVWAATALFGAPGVFNEAAT